MNLLQKISVRPLSLKDSGLRPLSLKDSGLAPVTDAVWPSYVRGDSMCSSFAPMEKVRRGTVEVLGATGTIGLRWALSRNLELMEGTTAAPKVQIQW
jgi:hypothetical protein